MSVNAVERKISLIDTHVHLDDSRFDADREVIYRHARDNGITDFIVPATVASRWSIIENLARRFKGVHATAGLHPCFTNQHGSSDLMALERQLQLGNPVAVGECGLDGYVNRLSDDPQANWKLQHEIFVAQLELARQFELPVIIHARNAVEAVIQLIRKHGPDKGVVHSYSGSLQQARQLIDLG